MKYSRTFSRRTGGGESLSKRTGSQLIDHRRWPMTQDPS